MNILRTVGLIHFRRQQLLAGSLQVSKLTKYLILDRNLNSVGKLIAVRTEELDTVILPWIVRSRDNHSRGEPMFVREKRNCGRYDDTCTLNRRSPCNQT